MIASVLGVSAARAAAIAAEYPLAAYPAPVVALSILVSDANFACPALQVDRWTPRRVPTFALRVRRRQRAAAVRGPTLPPIATHSSEIQYLFDQPNAPFPAHADHRPGGARREHASGVGNFAAERQSVVARSALAVDRRRCARDVTGAIAAELESGYSADHHCAFWAAG